MNRLSRADRIAVIRALVEGNSVRSTSRMTDVARNTILSLLMDVGRACWDYQDRTLRNLKLKRVQVDEIWSFVYAKQKNVATAKAAPAFAGDVWTFTAIDAETKLVPCWMLGSRDLGTATEFIQDLAGRIATRIQLTTDGHKPYVNAVEDAFGADVDFAQLVKLYGAERPGEARYSCANYVSCRKVAVTGNPDEKHISTSYVERQNLTMRMSMRRFTRLTNAFSKKAENHAAMVALYFMHYNFARVHQTLRVTPAMAAGVADHVWEVEEIVALVEAQEAVSDALISN
jgi:IS1 family transposase